MDWTKIFTSLNVFVYKASNGRLGNKMGKQSVLVLSTTGWKTGKHYETTLSYYRDGERYLIVASNWGKESHPGWYFNLVHQPRATIQVGPRNISILASNAEGEDYQRLWSLVTEKNNQYLSYQAKMNRRIPIMILTPSGEA